MAAIDELNNGKAERGDKIPTEIPKSLLEKEKESQIYARSFTRLESVQTILQK